MNKLSILAPSLFGLLTLAACGGSPSDVYLPSANAESWTETTTAGDGGEAPDGEGGTGGAGGGAVDAATTGAGGDAEGGGAPVEIDPPVGAVCEGQGLSETTLPACGVAGSMVATYSGTIDCPTGPFEEIGAQVFTVDVAAGDCVHVRVDNAGSSGADMLVMVADATSGEKAIWDDERDCTVPNVNGYGCGEGASTVPVDGPVHIIVASWDGIACPAGQPTPFQLDVSVNGVAVDLSDGPSCAVDLNDL